MESIATTEEANLFKPASFASKRKSSTGLRLQIIPFRARHVPLVKPDAPVEMLELAQVCESHHGWTACLLGDPVGCAGVVMQQAGIGEVWSIFSPLVKCLPKQMFRECKRLLAEVIEKEKPKKLYTIINEDDLVAARFVKHLLFADAKKRIYAIEFPEVR